MVLCTPNRPQDNVGSLSLELTASKSCVGAANTTVSHLGTSSMAFQGQSVVEFPLVVAPYVLT